MKVTVNNLINDGVYYSKTHHIHFANKDIISLDSFTNNKDYSIDKVIQVISNLNGFTDNEYIIYKYFILLNIDSIKKDNTHAIISLTNKTIKHIAESNNISISSINRAIKSLLTKRVINWYITDNGIVPANYVLNINYNFAYNFANNVYPKAFIITI